MVINGYKDLDCIVVQQMNWIHEIIFGDDDIDDFIEVIHPR